MQPETLFVPASSHWAWDGAGWNSAWGREWTQGGGDGLFGSLSLLIHTQKLLGVHTVYGRVDLGVPKGGGG